MLASQSIASACYDASRPTLVPGVHNVCNTREHQRKLALEQQYARSLDIINTPSGLDQDAMLARQLAAEQTTLHQLDVGHLNLREQHMPPIGSNEPAPKITHIKQDPNSRYISEYARHYSQGDKPASDESNNQTASQKNNSAAIIALASDEYHSAYSVARHRALGKMTADTHPNLDCGYGVRN